MSTERIITTGATGGHSNRLEIHDLIQDERQFSLYIQALCKHYGYRSLIVYNILMNRNAVKIYQLPQDHILSFFQTGGIHGLPPIPWDPAGSKLPAIGRGTVLMGLSYFQLGIVLICVCSR